MNFGDIYENITTYINVSIIKVVVLFIALHDNGT